MDAQIVLCDGFEVVPPPDINHLILFRNNQNRSYCDESTITTEEEERNLFSGDSSPEGGAEEEWPEAKSFSFYFVKQPFYDDPEIKTKIDNADQEIYQCNKLRIDISNAQKFERAELSSLSAQMESSICNWEGCRLVSEAKKREFDTLEESLRNLWCSSSDQLCFSKEELDHLIYRAHYHIEHGSNGLEDELWIIKETEKPDGIILSEDSLAEKEASIHRVKSMAIELNEVKKELDAITWKINHLNDKIGTSQKNIKILDVEMAHVLEKRDRSFERIKMLRLQRDKGNAAFYQSFAVMRKAKDLAASANVRDLEVLASSEVDKFMDHWNNDKAFRDDYVKRVSFSLCERQLSRDGRIRDPPVQVVREMQVPFETLKGGEEVYKTNREDSSSSSNSSQGGNVITDKQKKEGKKEAKNFNRSSAEESDVIDLEFSVNEKPKKEEEDKVGEETLKKREREEQIEKARLAMERKRKLQEKAAAKAAVRAQKEAEKKLKECEKKAKKKAAANSFSPSKLDQSREVNDLEKVKNLAVSGKEKHQKERSLFPKQRSFRYKHRGRGTEALPKVILNRRKAQKYWVWGLSSAALAFALVLVFLLLR